MASLIWRAKSGTMSSYQQMKSPSSYKIEWEDLDKNSYRSTINGNLFRHPLSKHWYKIGFTYSFLTPTELKTIVGIVNADNLNIQCQSPAFGTASTGTSDPFDGKDIVTLQGYVAKMSTEMIEGQLGYALTFNFVESRR